MKKIIAGVDEVGRGSLAGPVYAAAVIFKSNIIKNKIKDSKQLKKSEREFLSKHIKKNSIWSLGTASLREIEKFNILNASLLAMKRAIKKLQIKPNLVIVDGNKSPEIKSYLIKVVVQGDQKIKEVSAASIIAKVSRDKLMKKMSKRFKNYKWELNAGYGTKEHIKAIKKFGITQFHRKTFKPIHNMLSLKKKQ